MARTTPNMRRAVRAAYLDDHCSTSRRTSERATVLIGRRPSAGSRCTRTTLSSRARADGRFDGFDSSQACATSPTRARPPAGSIHWPRALSASIADRLASASAFVATVSVRFLSRTCQGARFAFWVSALGATALRTRRATDESHQSSSLKSGIRR
jgi:hypothetical protein